MEVTLLKQTPRCWLCIHLKDGKCVNKAVGYDSMHDNCMFFSPDYNVTVSQDELTRTTVKIEEAISRPAYRKDEPTYTSGYLLSKFGKL